MMNYLHEMFMKRIRKYLDEAAKVDTTKRDELVAKLEKDGFKTSVSGRKITLYTKDSERVDTLKDLEKKLHGTYNTADKRLSSKGQLEVGEFRIIAKPTGKSKNEGDGVNVDDVREVAALWMMDLVINKGVKSVGEASKYIEEGKSSGKIKSEISLESVKNYLLNNPSKMSISFQNAIVLSKNAGYIGEILNADIDLSSYTFHHKTTEYNTLMKLGKTLSGISVDKWNPADALLIRGTAKTSFKDIIELNSYINSPACISISLKEGDTKARHGKFAVSNIYNEIQGVQYTSGDVYDKLKKAFANKNVTNLNLFIPKAFGTSVLTREIFEKAIEGNKDIILRSLDTQLDLWADVTQETFKKAITYAVAGCTSELPTSSSFFKIDDKHCKYYDVKNNVRKVDIEDVYHTIGETQVVTKIEYDGKPIKLQCRLFSANAKSQFEMISSDYKINPSKVIKVTAVK